MKKSVPQYKRTDFFIDYATPRASLSLSDFPLILSTLSCSDLDYTAFS